MAGSDLKPTLVSDTNVGSDVVVLGGGFAGLACATALAEAGARVTVLEKKPHLGGRAFSFKDPRSGEIVDNGQHLFMGCYRQTLRFLERVGSRALLRLGRRARVAFADASGARATLDCPALPAPWNLALGVARLGGLGWRDKAGLLRLGAWFRANVNGAGVPPELDRVTVREWMSGLGLSSRLQERLLDPIAIGALNEQPTRASALGLAQVLRDVFFRDADGAKLGLASVGLSELYTEQAKAFVEARGGRVLTGVKASAIELGAAARVRTESSGDFAADAVVSALPPKALARLDLPAALRGGWETLESAPIIGINLWLERPAIDEPLLGLLGTELHWAFNKNALWDRREDGQYLALVISGAHAHVGKSPAELLELAAADLALCVPSFKKDTIRRWTVVKEPEATLSPAVGSDALRPQHRSVDPRFLFAGDWTRTGLPATIESAVASGHRCAEILGAKAPEGVGHA